VDKWRRDQARFARSSSVIFLFSLEPSSAEARPRCGGAQQVSVTDGLFEKPERSMCAVLQHHNDERALPLFRGGVHTS
jgi:hypothetical protein